MTLRLAALATLALFAADARAQVIPIPSLPSCAGLDAPACTAWTVGASVPAALSVGSFVAYQTGAWDAGLALTGASLVVGPSLGYAVGGHAAEALPGMLLRGGVAGVAVGLLVVTADDGESLGDLLAGRDAARSLLVVLPATIALSVLGRADAVRLHRMLADDSAARTVTFTLVPEAGGASARLALAL